MFRKDSSAFQTEKFRQLQLIQMSAFACLVFLFDAALLSITYGNICNKGIELPRFSDDLGCLHTYLNPDRLLGDWFRPWAPDLPAVLKCSMYLSLVEGQ